jgi:hypothetical protein
MEIKLKKAKFLYLKTPKMQVFWYKDFRISHKVKSPWLSRRYSVHFVFNLQKLYEVSTIMIILNKSQNWGSESSSNLPNVTHRGWATSTDNPLEGCCHPLLIFLGSPLISRESGQIWISSHFVYFLI